MIYHLYLKTHNITGLKYLGKTTSDPYKYHGSGKYWLRHLKIYGKDISTEVLGSYETLEEFKKAGLYYSELWNVVESDQWANLVPEDGYGSGGGKFLSKEGRQRIIDANRKPCKEETRRKIGLANKGRYPSLESRKKSSISHKGQIAWNKGLTKDIDSRVRTKTITFNNETLTIGDWAKKLGIYRQSLYYRLKHWTLERALTK